MLADEMEGSGCSHVVVVAKPSSSELTTRRTFMLYSVASAWVLSGCS